MFITNLGKKCHISIFLAVVLKAELGMATALLFYILPKKSYLNPICFFFKDLLFYRNKISRVPYPGALHSLTLRKFLLLPCY